MFLDGGRVGQADLSHDPLRVRFPGGVITLVEKKLVLFHRTQQQIDTGVAGMIDEISAGKNLEENGKRFKILGAAAHRNLREYVSGTDPEKKRAAIFALRYCWVPGIEADVLAAFENGDYPTRQQALMALWGHQKESLAAESLRKWADDTDEKTAALVFNLVDRYFPDASLKRIRRLLRDEDLREAALPRLSHYQTRELTPDLLPLLERQSVWLRRCAMIGLISQLANDASTRKTAHRLLEDESAELREIAAEYFTWVGESEDILTLKEALTAEPDAHTRAALAAAVAALERREKGGVDAFRKGIDAIAGIASVEPLLVYEIHEHAQQAELIKRNSELQRLILGSTVDSRGSPSTRNDYPAATAWMPPVRDYFNAERKSYGVAVAQRHATFSGSVHVGDDCAWGDELKTVVCAADGIVRSVSYIQSWGYIVVVEHRTEQREKFCTLYAHLSPLVHVKPGEVIAAGQKIGSVGRTNTVENGGYYAHLHFAIHKGSYANDGQQWVCGYVSAQTWQAGLHGWLSPQQFLKARLPLADESE
ncbi:MAG TPA: peptidoglycan DD-metalloendopeptidase family protein [Planctomycetota bacterium]|nr:peptidoglycan DD-metalloendopeptidase family protein [Planctomycetota bacterium]